MKLKSEERSALEEIDEFVQVEMEKQHLPGLSLALVQNGDLVQAKGYGVANVELESPVTPDTVFQIGSLTKQFTAAALMLLVEADDVRLDESIRQYLKGLPDSWSGITVRQLLHHTSGLTNVTELPDFNYRIEYTQEELTHLLAPLPLEFEPGHSWRYSNTGYVLLGWIIGEASGQSYGDFLHERIFEPLGMVSTRIIQPREIVPGRAAGYCWNRGLCNGDSARPQAIVGAGGLLSTTLDLAKWDAALYTEKPLSRSLKEEIWTPARLADGSLATTGVTCGDHYGFGWFLGEHGGRALVSHTGETDAGFSSEIIRCMADRFTAIMLCNVEPMEQDRIIKGIAERFFKGQP